MKQIARTVAGLLLTVIMAIVLFAALSAIAIKLTGPHTPLIPFAGLLALAGATLCNIAWQRRVRAKR